MLFLCLWSIFLVHCPSFGVTEGNNQDVCWEDRDDDDLYVHRFINSSVVTETLERSQLNKNFSCLLHPNNVLNCSWSFLTEEEEEEDTQLSVHISVCDDTDTTQSLDEWSVGKSGWRSLVVQQQQQQQQQHPGMLSVILRLNVSRQDQWTVYDYKCESDRLEVLPPPQNISAAVTDGGLLVNWDLPDQRVNSRCFEYHLDVGDQEAHTHLQSQLSYTKPSTDPNRAYRVRMRTRKRKEACLGSTEWSEWSPSITVKAPGQPIELNNTLIISISFGIPMILLALVLLVHHQRLTKALFPPIPRPPNKYKYYLEENDTYNFFHPVLVSKAEEEITVVENWEETSAKTF